MSAEQQPDEFDALVAGLDDEIRQYISYDERAGCYVISLDEDTSYLRQKYYMHCKDLLNAEPGEEIRHEEYEFVEYIMNKTDSLGLRELAIGDHVATASEAVMIYHDEATDEMAYVPVAADESIVGIYEGVTIIPSPSIAMTLARESHGDLSLELSVIIVDPHIETSEGDIQNLHLPAVIVPILDPEVKLVKRMYNEGAL